jgi:death on curing protein
VSATGADQPFKWLGATLVHAVHGEQLAEHGGAAGVRDENLLNSALARPQHLASYGTPDICDCAAAYGYGISRNHPFIDGNKRTALVVAALFLRVNGRKLVATQAQAVVTMLEVAQGTLSEPDFAAWIRANSALL